MKRLFIKAILVIAIALPVLGIAKPSVVNASSFSPGCTYINANGGASVDNAIKFYSRPAPMVFFAGETVVVQSSGVNDFIVIGKYLPGPQFVPLAGSQVSFTSYTISYTIPATEVLSLFLGSNNMGGDLVTLSCLPAGPTPLFTDGRLNKYDAGQTFAVYCLADGSVKVLAIYKGEGYLAFTASPAEIAKISNHPATNTAIKSGNGATLYRLTSGELQVNRPESEAGKEYFFTFDDCATPESN